MNENNVHFSNEKAGGGEPREDIPKIRNCARIGKVPRIGRQPKRENNYKIK